MILRLNPEADPSIVSAIVGSAIRHFVAKIGAHFGLRIATKIVDKNCEFPPNLAQSIVPLR